MISQGVVEVRNGPAEHEHWKESESGCNGSGGTNVTDRWFQLSSGSVDQYAIKRSEDQGKNFEKGSNCQEDR